MIKVTTLARLDLTANAVQFKNVATGQYIALRPDAPGGYLAAVSAEYAHPWCFYQASGAQSNNVEIKRADARDYNWTNYDQRVDATSGVACNHASRLGGTTSPTAPHPWFLGQVGDGTFNLRCKGTTGEEVLELVPTILHSTGEPKLITRPASAGNAYQQWEIWADKVNGPVIEIQSAQYGVTGSMADVSVVVQSFADCGDASFDVRNHILGGDPAVGVQKHIVLSYRIDGVAKEQTVTEGRTLTF